MPLALDQQPTHSYDGSLCDAACDHCGHRHCHDHTGQCLSGSPLPLVGESPPTPCPCPFPHGTKWSFLNAGRRYSVRHEMLAAAAHCTIDCIAHQICAVCHRRKAPRGRSVPLEMANGLCTDACEGYQQDPKPGHLWPDEEAEVFRTAQAVR